MRVGQHNTGTTGQSFGLVDGAHQAMNGMAIVFVGFSLVWPHRLKAQFTGVDIMADEVHIAYAISLQRWHHFKILPIAIAQCGALLDGGVI